MKIHEWLLWVAQDLGIMVSYDPDNQDKGCFYPDLWMIHINCLNPEVMAHELGHAYLYKYVEGEAYQRLLPKYIYLSILSSESYYLSSIDYNQFIDVKMAS